MLTQAYRQAYRQGRGGGGNRSTLHFAPCAQDWSPLACLLFDHCAVLPCFVFIVGRARTRARVTSPWTSPGTGSCSCSRSCAANQKTTAAPARSGSSPTCTSSMTPAAPRRPRSCSTLCSQGLTAPAAQEMGQSKTHPTFSIPCPLFSPFFSIRDTNGQRFTEGVAASKLPTPRPRSSPHRVPCLTLGRAGPMPRACTSSTRTRACTWPPWRCFQAGSAAALQPLQPLQPRRVGRETRRCGGLPTCPRAAKMPLLMQVPGLHCDLPQAQPSRRGCGCGCERGCERGRRTR